VGLADKIIRRGRPTGNTLRANGLEPQETDATIQLTADRQQGRNEDEAWRIKAADLICCRSV